MARFEITSPTGQRFEVTAPDGASQDEVLAYAKSQFASADPSKMPTNPEPTPDPGRFAAPQLAQTQAANPEVLPDMAKSFGSGLVKGGIGLATLPGNLESLGRMGINYAGRKLGAEGDTVSPKTTLPEWMTYGGMKKNVEGVTGPLYEPQTRAGKFAGAVGEFGVGGMIMPGGGIGLVNKAVRNVVAPAVASEGAGQLTEGTALEPWARVAGALVGPSAATPFAADPQRTRMVQALNNEGVTAVTAGQATGRRPLRWAESAIQDVPFTGQRAANMNTQAAEQYTAATLRRAGIDAPRATPEVIDQALTRIGGEFDAIAQNVAVPVTSGLAQRVRNIAQQYERVTEPSLTNRLPASIADDIARMNAGGPANPNFFIRGEQYQGWRSDIGAAARATQDPRTKRALYDLQHELDNAAENYLRRSGNPEMVDRMQNARREYRNMLVIEKAASAAGENAALGLISPSALRNAVKTAGLRDYARGRGDFAELSRAGEAILKPLPQSGTAPRMIAQELGKAAVGGAVGGAAYGQEGAGAGAAMPILAQALLGRAVMSRPMQAYMRNQMAAPGAGTNALEQALMNRVVTQAPQLARIPMPTAPDPNDPMSAFPQARR